MITPKFAGLIVISTLLIPYGWAEDKAVAIPDIQNYDSEQIRKKNDAKLDDAEKAARKGFLPKVPNVKMPASGIDVGQIANRYQEKQIASRNENLLIFVSLSMPKEALLRLSRQAQSTNAVLVIRGLDGGLTKGNWANAMASLKPITETGASVIIHPEYFKQYGVKQVPTFVLVSDETPIHSCDASKSCDAKLQSSGDVSLDYVLTRWADGTGPLAKIAKNKLAMLEDR